MISPRSVYRSEQGFTLIEVMAALTVFTIMTLGIVPLLLTSIRGGALSRSYTVGKNVALQATERARGFPYFVDYATQQGYSENVAPFRKVDLLDLYFPADIAGDVYPTTCSGSNDGNPACPRNLPPGYSLEFKARFVRPVSSGTQETYSLVPVPSTYSWNPNPYANQDAPPAQILELTVKSSWAFGGGTRSFEISSLIGDREFGEVSVRGVAKIDYLINLQTRYTDATSGAKSQLIATGGIAESRIETKTASTADQAVQAAEIELVEVPSDPAVTPAELDSRSGAASFHHAAPDAIPAGTSQGAQSIPTAVAGIDPTRTSNLKVSVSQELPTSTGSFVFDAPSGTERLLWANGQVALDNATSLRLDNSQDLVSFRPRPGKTATGNTSAITTSPSSITRGVETTASVSFGRLRILPTQSSSSIGGPIGSPAVTEKAVVVIDDFTASITCDATGTTSGGNAATGSTSWSATLYYWKDTNPADNIASGSYQSIPLSSASASDPLQPFPTTTNPLVYDGASPADDVYLFRGGPGLGKGYLQSWSSALGQPATVNGTGTSVKAGINEAIGVITAPTNPSEADSSISVSIANLSCESLDAR